MQEQWQTCAGRIGLRETLDPSKWVTYLMRYQASNVKSRLRRSYSGEVELKCRADGPGWYASSLDVDETKQRIPRPFICLGPSVCAAQAMESSRL